MQSSAYISVLMWDVSQGPENNCNEEQGELIYIISIRARRYKSFCDIGMKKTVEALHSMMSINPAPKEVLGVSFVVLSHSRRMKLREIKVSCTEKSSSHVCLTIIETFQRAHYEIIYRFFARKRY